MARLGGTSPLMTTQTRLGEVTADVVIALPTCEHKYTNKKYNDVEHIPLCDTCEICLKFAVCDRRPCYLPGMCPARMRLGQNGPGLSARFPLEIQRLMKEAQRTIKDRPVSSIPFTELERERQRRKDALNKLRILHEERQGAKMNI